MSDVRILTSEHPSDWLAVLERCRPYDFYHLPGYHALAEQQGEGIAHLFVYEEDGCTFALPLLLRSLDAMPGLDGMADGRRDATSVYGYAGPLLSGEKIAEEVCTRFQTALRATLHEFGVVSVFSRLHPLFPQQSRVLDGLGECKTLAKTVSLDLTLPLEEQRAQYRRNHKESIGKLRRKGIVSFHDPHCSELNAFVDLYHETMRRVGAAAAYFFPSSYFAGLHACLGPRLHLFGCRIEGCLASAGLFVECDGIVQFHLGGTRDAFLRLAPMKLLFDDVRIWETERGLRVLHLGGGATAQADDSLLHFKMGFSDRTHDFRVWRYVAAPEDYAQLCDRVSQWNERNGLRPSVAEYFPAYRSPTTSREPA